MLAYARTLIFFSIFSLSFHSSAQICSSVFLKSQISSQVESSPLLRLENILSWSHKILPQTTLNKKLGVRKQVEYIEIKTDQRKKLEESELFYDLSEVIIGIDTEGHTKGHVYMIINGIRIDGHILFAAPTETKKNWELSNGLFIRIKNLPEENKKRLLAWANSRSPIRAMTCVAVACKVLFDEAGLKGKPKNYFWFPSDFFGYLLKKGLIGNHKQKTEFEIYTLNQNLEQVLSELPTWLSLTKLVFMLFEPKTWGL